MASFADSVPPAESFIARLNIASYEGSFSRTRPIPISGTRAVGLDSDIFAAGVSLLWRPPVDLGEKWSYAMSATIPYVWMDVSGEIASNRPIGPPLYISRSDSIDGIGDIVLMPLMLNYNVSPDFNVNFRAAAYAPTGSYETGRLANTGKNFWTIEPTLGLMYFGKKNGFEASVFIGYDWNEENDATNYQSGEQFHIDGTLAQHFPLAGGLIGVGVSGFYYDQMTGDTGSGAVLGDFKGRATGFGPVLSWVSKVGGSDMVAEIKWLHETDADRRLEGDYIWGKLLFKF